MNGGRRTGRLGIVAAFWGLGAGLLLAGVAAASEAAHGGGHGGISPEKMQDLLWRTVNFVVFAAILIYLVAKPAKKFFAQRSQDVATTLEEMEARQVASEAAVKAAEARLAAVAKERQNVIQQFIAEGEMKFAASLLSIAVYKNPGSGKSVKPLANRDKWIPIIPEGSNAPFEFGDSPG